MRDYEAEDWKGEIYESPDDRRPYYATFADVNATAELLANSEAEADTEIWQSIPEIEAFAKERGIALEIGGYEVREVY